MKKRINEAFMEDKLYDYNVDVLRQNLDGDGNLSEFGQGGVLFTVTFQKYRPVNR